MTSDSNRPKLSTCSCCCGPYPTIECSPLFFEPSNSNEKTTISTLKDNVAEACAKYGCFHVTIDTNQVKDKLNRETLSVLLGEEQVKGTIATLFEHEFLKTIHNENDDNNTSASKTFSFLDEYNVGSSSSMVDATYRGRSAESGSKSSKASQGEPKQSWEIFRNAAGVDVVDNSTSISIPVQRLQVLQSFVKALHEIVVVLCLKALDLPKNTFVSPLDKCSNESKDLLRVFRYDALATIEEQQSYLGSSSHTDWGCMTAVWQDSKGGLQIYCHEHECWNNVDVKLDGDHNDSICRVFMHVGDFLSLSINSIVDDGGNIHPINISDTGLQWSSPTHRVICPLRVDDGGNTSENSRCSLVYFAYPPNGVSLSDAIISLRNTNHLKKYQSSNSMILDNSEKKQFPYERFMVLNNQSYSHGAGANKSENEISEEIFQEMLGCNFDRVISEKWNQVQRS